MNPNFLYGGVGKQFPYSPMQPQNNTIPFKPVAFERVSDILGIAYNLSAMDNVSVLPAPRQNEQQIFFINNDDKIYTRTAEAGIGIIGYKQEYVQNLENELAEAQSQLYEILNSVTDNVSTTPQSDFSSFDSRLTRLEQLLEKLMEEQPNESKGFVKNVGSISDLA